MPDYLTQCFDNLRTGWNPQEPTLTPDSIRQYGFGSLGQCVVDGQVYAQPLVVQNIASPGGSVGDFLLVATEKNWIYAFDTVTLSQIWFRHLLPQGERLVTPADVATCGNVAPFIGITSTPVVDAARKIMFVCAKSVASHSHGSVFHHRLYAINLHTGNDWKPPVQISATMQYGGQANYFNRQWQLQRPGLLLMNGVVYIGFGGHCDFHPGIYRCWVLAYDATTLQQVGAFVSTVSGLGGIWQAGRGLAGDGQFVYCHTGNGNLGGNDLGDSVLKLSIQPGNPLLQLNGFFSPCDQQLLTAGDADLGSGGPLLLPDQPGPFPHLMVSAGKEGTIYLLNRDTSLGGFQPPPAGWTPCDQNGIPTPCTNSNLVITTLWMVLGQAAKCTVDRDALFGGPAYYAPAGKFPRIYYSGQDEPVKVFEYDQTQGKLSGPIDQAVDAISNGSIPVVSSNGNKDGVLWVASRGGANGSRFLLAYDLDPNLGLGSPTALLANLSAGPFSTEQGGGASLGPPATVANARVYVAGDGQVTVFGLLKPQKGCCFIATAVAGRESPVVSTLVLFRETYLATSRLGQRFIILYERFSPAFARAIEKRRTLRVIARSLIVWPAFLLAKSLLGRDTHQR